LILKSSIEYYYDINKKHRIDDIVRDSLCQSAFVLERDVGWGSHTSVDKDKSDE
jgi:hypothetical protein